MNRESIHRKISEIIELLEVNNNRLFLHEEELSSFDLEYLKKLTLSLYEQIDSLGLSNTQHTISNEKTPEQEDIVPASESAVDEELEVIQEDDTPAVAEETIEQHIEEELITEEELDAPGPEPEVVDEEIQDVEGSLEESDAQQDEEAIEEESPTSEEPEVEDIKEASPSPESANLYERLRLTKIESVKRAISVSKRFEIQNALFDKNADRYNEAISQLDSAESLDAANTILNALSSEFDWDAEDELVQELQTILLRRYME